jgi:Na+-translocating ferredoxin:NAD+ oxidoreductase subunit B
MSRNVTPEQIDAILPQTQCGLCSYKGCMPYATALVNDNVAIDLCPPGGVTGLQAIAKLVNKDPTPYLAEMAAKAKPRMLAVIREDECIGCTKCIQACPVDAIVGGGKLMHTVITAECTGCELCMAPCPVDCIDMLTLAPAPAAETQQRADLARKRFNAREQRLSDKSKTPMPTVNFSVQTNKTAQEKQSYIQEAVARAKLKKMTV